MQASNGARASFPGRAVAWIWCDSACRGAVDWKTENGPVAPARVVLRSKPGVTVLLWVGRGVRFRKGTESLKAAGTIEMLVFA